MAGSILLIDDKSDLLDELRQAIEERLKAGEADVIAWRPTDGTNPKSEFDRLRRENDLRLVVTDADLTEGRLGLFGAAVVEWCQSEAIPVGDFSRGDAGALPKEPNLFELRVPVASNEEAASYVVALYRGFETIRSAIAQDASLASRRSPASALAALLGAKNDESQFAQYGTRYGGANSALIDRLAATAPKDKKPTDRDRKAMLSYIMGHLLLNAVLRFPGPIINRNALVAYLAVDISEHVDVEPLFEAARYSGPFNELGPYFWTSKVDAILANFEKQLPANQQSETPGEMNRNSVEWKLGRKLARPQHCERCHGKNGGFFCPFTSRTVCQLPDCSVVSNQWIPQGARLCRIEREFYDEWSPILGM